MKLTKGVESIQKEENSQNRAEDSISFYGKQSFFFRVFGVLSVRMLPVNTGKWHRLISDMNKADRSRLSPTTCFKSVGVSILPRLPRTCTCSIRIKWAHEGQTFHLGNWSLVGAIKMCCFHEPGKPLLTKLPGFK